MPLGTTCITTLITHDVQTTFIERSVNVRDVQTTFSERSLNVRGYQGTAELHFIFFLSGILSKGQNIFWQHFTRFSAHELQ